MSGGWVPWVIGAAVVFVFRHRLSRMLRWLLPIGALVLLIGLLVTGQLESILAAMGGDR